ncbi:proclotting enzyme-3 [Penaeus vannamei]|uniref:Proclotting enzyme-3 n=1 Tax=Penaeus vannamei TaxID=6689 RepID=A0A423T2B5_PENVA|nr:proclotting enzyme-3 [Penaeus vannamei]
MMGLFSILREICNLFNHSHPCYLPTKTFPLFLNPIPPVFLPRPLSPRTPQEEHDIALSTWGNSELGVGVQPICISTPDDFAVGQEVVIVGWGLTDFANKSSSSNLLREVTVTTIDLDQCITLYQNAAQRQFVNENMICTLTAGKDACSGDSGGPVIAQVDGVWVLLGIVSFGNGCADITAPGVHTNVANYVDWMIESIGGSFC